MFVKRGRTGPQLRSSSHPHWPAVAAGGGGGPAVAKLGSLGIQRQPVMDKPNPYAPSRASLAGAAVRPADGSGGTWRDGKVLVLAPDALLPHRCVKCNEPAEEPTKNRNVYWHSPWLYLLILLNILIYALIALLVRRKAAIAPGLCHAHKTRRRTGIAIAWGLLFVGFALIIAGARGNSPGAAFGGVLLMLAAAIVSTVVTRVLRAKRIDAQYVRLTGCGTPFLDSVPQFPG